MRTRVGLLAGVVLLSTNGLSFTQEYPHAFPREGATLLFENERVFVWEARWPSGVDQPYHRHRYDMTGVFLAWGPLRVTRIDGTFNESREPFEIPRVFFQGKGVTHKEEGIGPPVRHSIMIDMKEYTAAPMTRRTDVDPGFPADGAGAEIDNDRVRIWDVTMQAGQTMPVHYHDKDMVVVVLEGGTILSRSEDGQETRRTWAYKDVEFVPRGLAHAEEVVSGSPRMMVFELK